MIDVVVGMGANVGAPMRQLEEAVRGLATLGRLGGISSLYETAPVGPPQPSFLNAAVRLDTVLEPEALLVRLRALERAAGRVRRERWGPRTLDLDVLWIRGRAVACPTLSVPHPRLAERAFALVPLLEVAAEAVDPVTGAAYSDVAARLGDAGVRRLEGGPSWADVAILAV